MILWPGKDAPEFLMAERTRSRDSSMALSGRPTMAKAGRPALTTSTSTSTRTESRPTVAPERTLANIIGVWQLGRLFASPISRHPGEGRDPW